jgi:hypothetical protein
MIMPDTLKTLCSFTAPALTRAINIAGYKGDMFDTAEFVGMTNGGQFAYKVTFEEDGRVQKSKVFLTYDPVVGGITADY